MSRWRRANPLTPSGLVLAAVLILGVLLLVGTLLHALFVP